MKVIATTDLSRAGNDCYIHETVHLVETCGMYVVFGAKRTTGWYEYNETYTKGMTEDFDRAKTLYKLADGILED